MGVITTMLLPLLSIALLTVTEVISQEENLSSLAGSETRIVGGTVVEPPHKYPFQVYFAAGNYACGGSILDPHHVLTAQHCLFDEEGNLHEPASCFIVAGAHIRPGGGRRCGVEEESKDWEVVGVETF